LCGRSQPSDGTGLVAGFDIAANPEMVKRNIGYMSQKFSLYEDLSVNDNLTLFATIYGMKNQEIKKRKAELYDFLEMTDIKNSLVRDIPIGWKQRLAFAAATIHNPKVVFLDEPTGGVDPITRRRFWELIYKVSSEGMTVFVTTHYLDEAEYCNRVSIMVDGRIKALDSPDELKLKYGVETMDAVFRKVAEGAQRSE
ncbi:MAG: ABC transporter ATP-binding protein, partial [Muribaculaceae bacterium]|nr:ABC transporter ATP-binding protein [Muribaculaceae bacterium]